MHRPSLRLAQALLSAGLCLVPLAALAAEPEPAAAPPTGLAEAVTPATSKAEQVPLLQLRVAGLATAGQSAAYAVDATGAKSPGELQIGGRLRLGVGLDTGDRLGTLGLLGALAAEVAPGTWQGSPTLPGDRLPGSRFDQVLPAEGWLGLGWGPKAGHNAVQVRAGLMGSHWGLGLLANDGRPEQAGGWFQVPQVGDRVMRLALVLTPWRGTDSPLRGLVISAGADEVVDDDVLISGDKARQIVGAVRMFLAADQSVGVYYAARDQEGPGGRGLQVHALDAAADLAFSQGWGVLRLQAESALIIGKTSLAPTPEFPEHDVLQGAVYGRGIAEVGKSLRFELDAGWLSGDTSLDDGSVTAFRADPNFQVGVLLFPQVLAFQSGRARLRASDPDLVGQPNDDLDRLATGGAATSAIVLFPKAGAKFGDHAEVFGGALLALAPSPLTDPRASRTVGGGQAYNFLGQEPDGLVLGTEIDLGVRARLPLKALGGDFVATAEAALLLPGGALAGLDEVVPGGRLTLAYLPR